MENLFIRYRERIRLTDTTFVRYLEPVINWDSKLIAILGARGVGKTTMLLQHIKMHGPIDKSLYVSADDIYFSNNSLVTLAEKFYHAGGLYLYIDEIHRYANWSVEIKNIYDSIPDLHVIYTGSSILDLEKGGADLSRRKLQYTLYGMSFREYLSLKHGINIPVATFEDVIHGMVNLPIEHRPLEYFNAYLREGYYPFFREPGFLSRLNSVITTTLEVDIPTFANYTVATARKLKRLMYIIAQSVPFKPNMAKIARDTGLDRNALNDVFVYMEKAGMISQLRTDVEGVSLLGKVDKVYLDNTCMAYALTETIPDIGNIRETFFYTMTRVTHNPLSSRVSDFVIGDYTFEIGGKKKGMRQIEGLEKAFIVKDDLETAGLKILPLWTFGMMY